MTLDGVKKAGIIGSSIIAITALALKSVAENRLISIVAISAVLILGLWGATVQGYLDNKKDGQQSDSQRDTEADV